MNNNLMNPPLATQPPASQAGVDPSDIYMSMTDDQRLLVDALTRQVPNSDLATAAALAGLSPPSAGRMDPEERAMAEAVALVMAGKASLLLKSRPVGTSSRHLL